MRPFTHQTQKASELVNCPDVQEKKIGPRAPPCLWSGLMFVCTLLEFAPLHLTIDVGQFSGRAGHSSYVVMVYSMHSMTKDSICAKFL